MAVRDAFTTRYRQGKKETQGSLLWPPCAMGSGARPDCGSTASAALGRFLGRLRIGLGFILAFAGGWILFLAFLGAHGTARVAASAAARGRLLHLAGAPGARFGSASAAARGVRAGHADAAGADQAGNAESGEQFLQILAFHTFLPVQDDGCDRIA